VSPSSAAARSELAAARHLADSGAEVVLYEREGIASGSTGRAAGICYDAFAEDLDAEIGAQSLHHFRELGVNGVPLRLARSRGRRRERRRYP